MRSNQGDFKKAIDDYNRTLSADNVQESTKYQTKYNLGICLRKTGDFSGSIKELTEAINIKPDEAKAHNNLGLSHFENESYDEALASYIKAISHCNIDKKEWDDDKRNEAAMLYYNKATVCERSDRFDEALEAINEAIEFYDKDPNFHYMWGNIYYQMGWLDQAHENYDEAIWMEPNNDRFWHQKGLAY